MAVMVHSPALTPVTVLPLTVQTAGVVELKLTARPEVAVALAVVVPLTAREVGVKVMVSDGNTNGEAVAVGEIFASVAVAASVTVGVIKLRA